MADIFDKTEEEYYRDRAERKRKLHEIKPEDLPVITIGGK